MAIDAFVKPLLQLEIFQGLRPLQITEIARRAYRVVYKQGDVILTEDADADAAVIIVSGDAVRISGPGLNEPAQPIPAGAILAEMAMLIETRASSTIIARGPVRALRIAREEVHSQMAEDSALADHFVRRITARLSVVLEELRDIDGSLSRVSEPVPVPAGRSESPTATPVH